MPAIAALTINDGLGVPVAHTFSPVSTDGSKAQWADRSPSVPAGFRLISQEVLPPSGNRSTYKVTWGFMFPVLATVDGTDVVVRYTAVSISANFHPNSTLQERKDAMAYVGNTLANAAVKTSVENLEPHY